MEDLEIDELTQKIESLEKKLQNRVPSSKKLRKEFKRVNIEKRDMFISINSESKYREFEQWLLMKMT